MDMLLGSTPDGDRHLGPLAGTADPTVGDKVCRLTTGGSIVFCDPIGAPSVIDSGAPLTGSGLDVVAIAVVGGAAVTFTLPGSDTDDASAALTFAVSTAASEGTVALVGSDATFTPPASSTAASATFAYTVTSGSTASAAATVRVIYSTAPAAASVSNSLVEDRNTTISFVGYDPIGLDVIHTVISLPLDGTVYKCDSIGRATAALSPADLPISVGANPKLVFDPFDDVTSTQTFTYTVTNSAGLTSASATVTVDIFMDNDMSTSPDTNSITLPASGAADLSIATTDPDNAFVSVVIDALPVLGELFYDSGDVSTPMLKFNPFFQPVRLQQYGYKILETSTYWPDLSKKWHPDQVLGAPDAAFNWGDSDRALAFSSNAGSAKTCGTSITTGTAGATSSDADAHNVGFGNFGSFDPVNGVTRQEDVNDCWDGLAAKAKHLTYSEFFTVQFEKSVYIKDLEIGENRGMGAITSIEAYDYESKEWMVMWSGDVDLEKGAFFKSTNQYSIEVPYPLCQPSFKTDIVKIKVNTVDNKDWNEYDYIKLQGSESRVEGLLQSNGLHYVAPEAGLDCIDSFSFATSDCGGQARRQTESKEFLLVPAGGSSTDPLPVCAAKITVTAESLVTTYTPASFDAKYTADYTYTATAAAAADDGTQAASWTYDATSGEFTFDWTSTNSDKIAYHVEFVATNTASGAVFAKQHVTFEIPEEHVRLQSDIVWTSSSCNENNEVEIKYRFSEKGLLALGGMELPADVTVGCAEVPAYSSMGIIIMLLSIVGFVVCTFFAAYVLLKKKHPVMRSSQPLFCGIFASGCALICIQTFVYLGEASDVSCLARYFLYNLLFTLAFGSLFAKTWRVWKVFANKQLKKVRVKNRDTLKVLGFLLFVEVGLLLLGHFMAPYEAITVPVEFAPGRFYDTMVCESKTSEYHLLSLAFHVTLVAAGCYLSWATRGVNAAFAESRYIMMAIYQVAVYGLVAAVVGGSGGEVGTVLLIQTICSCFGAVCCVSSVLVPKLVLIAAGEFDHGVTSGSLAVSDATSDNAAAHTSDDGNSSALGDKVDSLNAKIQELEKIIQDTKIVNSA